ncbi:tail fiber domain-containing protein [Maribellus mangrovi]|uniref:tail fiber domain-containing protein n=1 Tax=Maribellus mangrovi TaxID=3133146 RepID=UPI0030EE6BAC
MGDRETDDPNKDLSMQVFGKYGTYLTNGKIAVGDYGRVENNGANVFVGELGTNWDSDRLELHGKKGIYLTYEQGYDYGDIIGKWDIDQPDRFQFEVDVYAKGIKLNSDEKFKTNIKPLGKKLNVLKQLKGVSYKLKEEKVKVLPEEIEGLSEKEQADVASISTSKTNDRNRLGFLAQDVEALFPELVEKDKDGY